MTRLDSFLWVQRLPLDGVVERYPDVRVGTSSSIAQEPRRFRHPRSDSAMVERRGYPGVSQQGLFVTRP